MTAADGAMVPPTDACVVHLLSVFTRGALPEPLAALICGSLRVVMLEKDKGLCVTLHSTLGDKTQKTQETGRTEHTDSSLLVLAREREHTRTTTTTHARRADGRRLSQKKTRQTLTG